MSSSRFSEFRPVRSTDPIPPPTPSDRSCRLTMLTRELKYVEQEVRNVRASINHDASLSLSDESSSDPIESYLLIKSHDRLIATQLFRLEEERKLIEQEEEWNEIMNLVEIERERFRSEVEKSGDATPIVPIPMTGMEWQIEELEIVERKIEEFGVKKEDKKEKEEKDSGERRRIASETKRKLSKAGRMRKEDRMF